MKNFNLPEREAAVLAAAMREADTALFELSIDNGKCITVDDVRAVRAMLESGFEAVRQERQSQMEHINARFAEMEQTARSVA